MKIYLTRRFIQLFLVVTVVSIAVFLALNLSGDPAALMAPLDIKPAELEALRHRMGLDRPLPERYIRFLRDMITGRLYSYKHQQPPSRLIFPHLFRSLELGLLTMIIAPMIAIPLGIIAAVRRHGLIHRLIMTFALMGQAIPIFLLATFMIWIFAVYLRWVPVSGRGSIRSYILPVASMSIYFLAVLVRMTRASVLEVLHEDYVKTAHGKGLRDRLVLFRHVLPNAGLPILSLSGLQLAELLSGALVIETIFSWPGIGKLLYDAVLLRDIPLVVVASLTVAVMVAILNLIIDMAYVILDPRIRYA